MISGISGNTTHSRVECRFQKELEQHRKTSKIATFWDKYQNINFQNT
jgi:hypothetical protein